MVPVLAYLLPNWRHFTAACGASVVLALALAPWIPESPRWLLTHVCHFSADHVRALRIRAICSSQQFPQP